ncbi:B3 domain-containing transcription factor VRN1-like [Telopea speciosissima]|uniref:B3 domain-containing transcription factor VRN1-like n=1 Tax=Telopea speciosissima TaxID=54955 RepID=UPI001CC40C40|nr:B3 domain-containing transcription factor VRN1-like [Telopea speciosissima]
MRRCRRNREIPNSLKLPAETFCFFKIILHANIRYQRLRIPVKFIREFRDELSNIAVLQVPSGKIWSIGLRKCNEMVWFDTGWQEFVEYYSILENYFLVFRYDGNSKFYVSIFDTTTCEIEYPCDTMDFEENNPNGGCKIEEIEEQSCKEIFDVPPRRSHTTAASRKMMSDELEEQQILKSRGNPSSPCITYSWPI